MITIKKRSLSSVLCAAVLSVGLVSTANAALELRAGGMVYDTDLDITWTQDANMNGLNDWSSQLLWANSLNHGGVTGWELASIDQYNHLFYDEGISAFSPGDFTNVQYFLYWSGTEFVPNPNGAWGFDFFGGAQDAFFKDEDLLAWAVHSGDVGASPVPEPGTIALMGLGLVGLLGFGRRQRRR